MFVCVIVRLQLIRFDFINGARFCFTKFDPFYIISLYRSMSVVFEGLFLILSRFWVLLEILETNVLRLNLCVQLSFTFSGKFDSNGSPTRKSEVSPLELTRQAQKVKKILLNVLVLIQLSLTLAYQPVIVYCILPRIFKFFAFNN